MKPGDLCHIPQNVYLVDDTSNPTTIDITEKPITGVLLKNDGEEFILLFANGATWSVERKSVYPMRPNVN